MRESERFFFLRFQKTGSTALVQSICEYLGNSSVFPGVEAREQTFMAIRVEPVLKRFHEEPDFPRVLAGHFPLCLTEVLGVPFRTFTALRDPVERALSLLRARSQRGAERFRGRALEDLYEDPLLHVVIHNHMVKLLTMRPDEMGRTPLTTPMDFTEARYADALEKLQGIEVVGLQERMDDFCSALEARFGWELASPGVTNASETQPASQMLRRRIEDDNAMDVELYQHAVKLVASHS